MLLSHWNFLNGGSLSISGDVILVGLKLQGLFSFEIGDLHSVVEFLGLSINFGIVDMDLGFGQDLLSFQVDGSLVEGNLLALVGSLVSDNL